MLHMIGSSPWFDGFKRERNVVSINKDEFFDIVIIGGGISGIVTAESILRNTDLTVCVIDKGLVGHGATAYNAGQLTSTMERSISSLVDECGEEITKKTIHDLDNSWELIDDIIKRYSMKNDYEPVEEYFAIRTKEQLDGYIKEVEIREKLQLSPLCLFKVNDSTIKELETENDEYFAYIKDRAGFLNCLSFTEELADSLLQKYPMRLNIYENVKIRNIDIKNDNVLLKINKNKIVSKKIVFCTNTLKKINIKVENKKEINRNYIDNFYGFASSFEEVGNSKYKAISYLDNYQTDVDIIGDDIVYFYTSKRRLNNKNLLIIGGLEHGINKKVSYENYKDIFIDKLNNTRVSRVKKETMNFWGGIMGYTKSRLRIVGTDPYIHQIMYNTACNGVGLLPAFLGAKYISAELRGIKLDSLFSPEYSLYKQL